MVQICTNYISKRIKNIEKEGKWNAILGNFRTLSSNPGKYDTVANVQPSKCKCNIHRDKFYEKRFFLSTKVLTVPLPRGHLLSLGREILGDPGILRIHSLLGCSPLWLNVAHNSQYTFSSNFKIGTAIEAHCISVSHCIAQSLWCASIMSQVTL